MVKRYVDMLEEAAGHHGHLAIISAGWPARGQQWKSLSAVLSAVHAQSVRYSTSPIGLTIQYGTWNADLEGWNVPPVATYRCMCGYFDKAVGTDDINSLARRVPREHAGRCPKRGMAAKIHADGALQVGRTAGE